MSEGLIYDVFFLTHKCVFDKIANEIIWKIESVMLQMNC